MQSNLNLQSQDERDETMRKTCCFSLLRRVFLSVLVVSNLADFVSHVLAQLTDQLLKLLLYLNSIDFHPVGRYFGEKAAYIIFGIIYIYSL